MKKNLNSRNSSKPPSQDPNRKKKKRNGKGGNQGGQKGHKGKTLEKVSDPDETIEYAVKECSGCHADLRGQESESYETRQVFEVLIKRRVVEHISSGTIYNFNKEAFEKLEDFDKKVKEKLSESPLNHLSNGKKECPLKQQKPGKRGRPAHQGLVIYLIG